MKEKKILSRTNPYLRNRAKRQKALFKSVCSSSAIEGIDARELLTDYINRKTRRITPPRQQGSGR